MEFEADRRFHAAEERTDPAFAQSEPEFLISYMDRHQDWAVIVCLVGGGQEINTGEAGIDAWLEAVNRSFRIGTCTFPRDSPTANTPRAERLKSCVSAPNTHFDDRLHLAVSMRSFRAENVSAFVKALLDCEEVAGAERVRRIGRAISDRRSRAI